VAQTGGPNTPWALAVKKDRDADRGPLQTSILLRYQELRIQAKNAGAFKKIEREMHRELEESRARHDIVPFVTWAAQKRPSIERGLSQAEEQKVYLAQQAAQKKAVKPPAQKKGRGR
jgi:hypothetical protein